MMINYFCMRRLSSPLMEWKLIRFSMAVGSANYGGMFIELRCNMLDIAQSFLSVTHFVRQIFMLTQFFDVFIGTIKPTPACSGKFLHATMSKGEW